MECVLIGYARENALLAENKVDLERIINEWDGRSKRKHAQIQMFKQQMVEAKSEKPSLRSLRSLSTNALTNHKQYAGSNLKSEFFYTAKCSPLSRHDK